MLICSLKKVLTGSAVAILQISVRKVSVDWTELCDVTTPLRTCAVRRRWLAAPRRLHPSAANEGMASTEARRECETEGCSRDAKLQCPTCIKLGIQGSFFCSQVPLLFSGRPIYKHIGCCRNTRALCAITRLLTVKLGGCIGACCTANDTLSEL